MAYPTPEDSLPSQFPLANSSAFRLRAWGYRSEFKLKQR